MNGHELEMAMAHTNDIIQTGQVLSGLSVIAIVAGGTMSYMSIPKTIDGAINTDLMTTGTILIYGGGLTAVAGSIMWIAGVNKRRDLEIALIKHQYSSDMGTPGIKLTYKF
ncbi:MAG: hypothetical protein ACLFVR_14715 [Thiohalospira sp.]